MMLISTSTTLSGGTRDDVIFVDEDKDTLVWSFTNISSCTFSLWRKFGQIVILHCTSGIQTYHETVPKISPSVASALLCSRFFFFSLSISYIVIRPTFAILSPRQNHRRGLRSSPLHYTLCDNDDATPFLVAHFGCCGIRNSRSLSFSVSSGKRRQPPSPPPTSACLRYEIVHRGIRRYYFSDYGWNGQRQRKEKKERCEISKKSEINGARGAWKRRVEKESLA